MLTLRLPEAFHDDLAAHPLHPALLDVATGAAAGVSGRHLPVAYRRMTVHRELGAALRAHVVMRSGDPRPTTPWSRTCSSPHRTGPRW